MKRAWLVALAMIAAILLSAVPATGAPTSNASESTAKKMAIFHVLSDAKTEDSGWRGGKVQISKGVDLFDTSGNAIGYLFSVKTAGQPTGFVVVGNQLDEYPILSFSYRHPIDADIADALAFAEGKKPVSDHKVVYLGGARFGLDLTFADGSTGLSDLQGRRVEKGPKAVRAAIPNSNKARAFWKQASDAVETEIGSDSDGVTDEDPDYWESGFTATDRNYISGVPMIYQWDFKYDSSGNPYATGCSPTAGAMIMQYWASNGYTLLGDASSNEPVVMGLRTTMGTTNTWLASCSCYPGSTDGSRIASGMQTYARNRGYATAVGSSVTATFSAIKTEVNASRPAVLSLLDQTFYKGNHSTTLVGWREYTVNGSTSGHQYMVVYDTWDSHPYDVFVAYGRNYSSIYLRKFNPHP